MEETRVMANMSGGVMVSTVRKRSIVIAHHKTSVSLEDDFWNALKEIAASRNKNVGDLVAEVALEPHANLSSHLRLFVLAYFQQEAANLYVAHLSVPRKKAGLGEQS